VGFTSFLQMTSHNLILSPEELTQAVKGAPVEVDTYTGPKQQTWPAPSFIFFERQPDGSYQLANQQL
jgi:hypothetical protein